jgi:putative redox protein
MRIDVHAHYWTEDYLVTARRMWYDTVGHGHVPALRCAIDSLGADRLVLGTDFPYEQGTPSSARSATSTTPGSAQTTPRPSSARTRAPWASDRRATEPPVPGWPGRACPVAWQGMGMADSSVHRTVTVERVTQGAFTVTNTRGGQLSFGTGGDTDFTPTELLLAAIAGCTAIDVDILTSRRAEPDSFQVRAEGDKVRDADGNRLTGIVVTFQIAFPAGAGGDEARAILPDAVRKSHDRLCTVGRTVETGTPIATRIE